VHEAKQWLRDLTADEVGSELAALDRGPPRELAKGSGGAAQGASPSQSGGVRPYAHPYLRTDSASLSPEGHVTDSASLR
jgi:hypothetical protein